MPAWQLFNDRFPVNQPRIWLLILLCALLPLRGAMAAAMVCPPADNAALSFQMQALPQAHGPQDHGSPHAHASAHANPGAHDHADAASAQDGCKMCAAFCSLTQAALGRAIVVAPVDMPAAPEPFLSAQPPSFIPGGLERPPRSI